MLKITKSSNTLFVEGENNGFYPNNGLLTYPMNSVVLVIDNTDMAVFKSAENGDVFFSAKIDDIRISGEAVTKENIATKFDAVANAPMGGGSTGAVESVNGKQGAVVLTAEDVNAYDKTTVDNKLEGKQNKLIDNVNFATINGQSLQQGKNITIESGEDNVFDATELFEASQKPEGQRTITPEFKDALLLAINNKKVLNIHSNGANVTITFAQILDGEVLFAATNNQIDYFIHLNTNDNTVAIQHRAVGTGKFDKFENEQGSSIFDLNLESTNNDIQVAFSSNDNGVKVPAVGDVVEVTDIDGNITDSGIVISKIKTADNVDIILESNNLVDTFVVLHSLKIFYNEAQGFDSLRVLAATHNVVDPSLLTEDAMVALKGKVDGKQDKLESGVNISTINNQDITKGGNINISGGEATPVEDNLTSESTTSALSAKQGKVLNDTKADKNDLAIKQDKLESGVNIATINGQTLLEGKDIVVEGSGVGKIDETPDAPFHGEIFNDYVNNKATGFNSHAEGNNTKATGFNSHAEGSSTTASSNSSHSEGDNTTASGGYSHAEGLYTTASGTCSHSAGFQTFAENRGQTSLGVYNVKEETPSPNVFEKDKTIFVIGNGTSEGDRSDAVKMKGDGTTWIGGIGDFTGKNPTTENSLQAVINKKADASSISDMATQTWVNEQNYLKSVPSEYVTDDELTQKNFATKDELGEKANASDLAAKQDTLISGSNIATINSNSLLDGGNIEIKERLIDSVNGQTGVVNIDAASLGVYTTGEVDSKLQAKANAASLAAKQDKLESGVNIATINGQSLLEGKDITIETPKVSVDAALSTESENPVQNKVITSELNKKVESVTLTQSEYDQLPEKNPNIMYIISDAPEVATKDELATLATKEEVNSKVDASAIVDMATMTWVMEQINASIAGVEAKIAEINNKII